MDQPVVLIIHEDGGRPGPFGPDAALLRICRPGGAVRRGRHRPVGLRRCHSRPPGPGSRRDVGRGHFAGDPSHVAGPRGGRHVGSGHRERGRRGSPTRRLRLRPAALRLQGPESRPPERARPGRPAQADPPSGGRPPGSRPVPGDRRPELRHQARPRPGQQGGPDALAGPDPGRERHGQGAGRPGAPRQQPARGHAPDDRRLRRPAGHPPRERALRPRARGVHGCPRPEARASRNGRPGDAVPRRDRRDEPGHPGQGAAGAPVGRVPADRLEPTHQGRHPGDRRDEQGPPARRRSAGASARISTTASR